MRDGLHKRTCEICTCNIHPKPSRTKSRVSHNYNYDAEMFGVKGLRSALLPKALGLRLGRMWAQ